MSNTHENKNGAGNPRNKRAEKNALENERLREEKKARGGLGAREARRLGKQR